MPNNKTLIVKIQTDVDDKQAAAEVSKLNKIFGGVEVISPERYKAAMEDIKNGTKTAKDVIQDFNQEIGKVNKNSDVKIKFDTSDLDKAKSAIENLLRLDVAMNAVDHLNTGLSSMSDSLIETADSMSRVKALTGATGEEYDKLVDMSKELAVNSKNMDFGEALLAVGTAKKQLGNFIADGDKGIADFTRTAAGLAEVFDKDISEVIQGSRTLIGQFGLEGQEAADLVALAMRDAGGKMDDVLDTWDEYAQHVKTAGYAAHEFTGIITSGMAMGVRDTDKLGDAIKEAQIRLNAGDSATAISKITSPINAQIENIVKLGEAGVYSVRDVLKESTKAIEEAYEAGNITAAIRDQYNTALAGTMSEDIGGEFFGKIFSADIDKAQIMAKGREASEAMVAAVEPRNMVEKITNEISTSLATTGAAFAPLVKGANDTLSAVSSVAPAFIAFKDYAKPIKAAATGVLGMTKNIKLATIAQKAMNLVMSASPWGIALAAIPVVVGGYLALKDALEETAAEQHEAANLELKRVQTMQKINKQNQNRIIQNNKLIDNYEKLVDQYKKTGEGEDELREQMKKLGKAYPGVIDSTKSFEENLILLKNAAAGSEAELAKLQNRYKSLTDQQKAATRRVASTKVNLYIEEMEEGLADAFGFWTKINDGAAKINEDITLGFTGGRDSNVSKLWEQIGHYLEEMAKPENFNKDKLDEIKGNFDLDILDGASGYIKFAASEFGNEGADILIKYFSNIIDAKKAEVAIYGAEAKEAQKESISNFQYYFDEIDKIGKNKAVSLETAKFRFDELTKKANEDLKVNKLNNDEYEKIQKLIADILATKDKSTEKTKEDTKAIEAHKKALEEYAAYLERIEKLTDKNNNIASGTLFKGTLDELKAQKQAIIDSQKELSSAAIGELIDLQEQIKAKELNLIPIKIGSEETNFNADIASRMQEEIEAAEKVHAEKIKAAKKSNIDTAKDEEQFQELIASIRNKYAAQNAEYIKKATASNNKILAGYEIDQFEAMEAERIRRIEGRHEREKEISIQKARQSYQAEKELYSENQDEQYEAYLRFLAKKRKADEDYLRATSAGYNLMSALISGSQDIDLTGGVDSARKSEIDRRREELKEERNIELERLRDGESNYEEYYSRLRELKQEDLELSKELGNKEAAFWEATRQAMLKSSEAMLSQYGAKLQKSTDKAILLATRQTELEDIIRTGSAEAAEKARKEKEKNELESAKIKTQMWTDFGIHEGAVITQMIADHENFGKIAVKVTFDALKQMAVIYAAEAVMSEAAKYGPIGLVTGGVAVAAIYAALAAAEAALSFEKGGSPTDRLGAGAKWIQIDEKGEEIVMNHRITSKMKPDLLAMNDYNITMDEHIKRNRPDLQKQLAMDYMVRFQDNDVLQILDSKIQRSNEIYILQSKAADNEERLIRQMKRLENSNYALVEENRKLRNEVAKLSKEFAEMKKKGTKINMKQNLQIDGEIKADTDSIVAVLDQKKKQTMVGI